MKKSLLFLAALSFVAIPFLFSCNKPDNGEDPEEEIVMPEPPSKDAAVKIIFPADDLPKYVDKAGEYEILQIEFTEANRYILQRRVTATKANVGDIEWIMGSYTTGANGDYHCQGDSFSGDVNVGSSSGSSGNASVGVNPTGEGNENNNYNGNANVQDTQAPASQDQSNAVRNWEVKAVQVHVSGKGIDIKKTFNNGCDLYGMAEWASNEGSIGGLKNRLSELQGYKVKEVTFTGDNTFSISFTGANTKAVRGNYTMNTTAKTVNFTLPEGNAFFHGSVPGSYTFPTDKSMELTMNTTVEGYTCELIMNMNRL